jgi:hypothetical protein
MTKVTGYAVRQRKDGSTFIVLELCGKIDILQSSTTGKMYATVRKTNIPSTFDENVAKMMIGSELEGDIVRVQVEPYDYVNKRTGEILKLSHSYSYKPKGAIELIGETKVQELSAASL